MAQAKYSKALSETLTDMGIHDSKTAAAYLGLSKETIRRYVYRGLLIPCGSVGNTYIFLAQELERFNKSRRRRGRPKTK